MIKEVWLDIPQYEGIYQVSNLGKVKSLDRKTIRSNGKKLTIKGQMLKPLITHRGYYRVSLSAGGKESRKFVHRLVMLAFVGESSLSVHHINEVKADNRLENLMYLPIIENVRISQSGSKSYLAKLNEELVIYIRKEIKSGVTLEQLSQKLNVNYKTLWDIKKRRTWKHI